jgi:hypothetical protein
MENDGFSIHGQEGVKAGYAPCTSSLHGAPFSSIFSPKGYKKAVPALQCAFMARLFHFKSIQMMIFPAVTAAR